MGDGCDECPLGKVHEVEFRVLKEALDEVKARVSGLESTLARGVILLVANLVGMVMTLARAFVQS